MKNWFKHLHPFGMLGMVEHYRAVRAELNTFGPWFDERGPLAFIAWRRVLAMRWAATVCEIKGHDYQSDGADYPDSGGEGFTCERCGRSFTAWH